MTKQKIIDGLYFTVGMILFNPLTGENKKPDELNEDDKTTYDACLGAIELLKSQEPQATTHEAEWHIFKGRRGATCSYCKYTFDDVYDPENYDYYCRHCGARMVRIRTVKWE